jgi:hypothetical protein
MRKVLVAVVGACLLAFCLFAQVAQAKSIKVCPPTGSQRNCQSYDTIQDAIDKAPAGSVISLTNDIYTEAGITIEGKDLTLRGQDPQKTIIQASPIPCQPVDKDGKPLENASPQRVLSVSNANSTGTVRLENLTIRHGCLTSKSESAAGAGIWSAGNLSLNRVVVMSNTIFYSGQDLPALGAGVYSLGGLEVENSSFLTNTLLTNGRFGFGGAIFSNGGARVVNSTFGFNQLGGCYEPAGPADRPGEYSGASIFSKAGVTAIYNTFFRNINYVGGGGFDPGTNATVINNLQISDILIPAIFCPFFDDEANVTPQIGPGTPGGLDPTCVKLSELRTDYPVPVFRQSKDSCGIDAAVCIAGINVDQVGDARNLGNGCDLGATEMGMSFMPSIFVPDPRPELKVVDISVEPAPANSVEKWVIKVVVENIGVQPARRDFWVDLYINPVSAPPNMAGTLWTDLCRTAGCTGDLGISWKVRTRLLPGERLTLTSRRMEDQFIWLDKTNWEGRFNTASAEMWAYVDSWNGKGNPSGWVEEVFEDNNRYGPEQFGGLQTAAEAAGSSAMFPSIVSDRPVDQE